MTDDIGRARPPTVPPVVCKPAVIARLDRPRTATTTRLAVVSDPHVASETEGTWKCFDRTEQLLERAVETAASESVDGVVVPGDLTKDGEPWNFRRYDDLVAPLDVPTVTIPGNHDAPKSFDDPEPPSLATFAGRYAPGGYPVHERIGGVDVIGLNSAADRRGSLYETWGGRVSDRQLAALDDLLDRAETPLVTVHHNLYGLADLPGGTWENFPMDGTDGLHRILAEHDVPLVVSGHQHIPELRSKSGVRELMAPAVCSYPQVMVLLEIGPEGTTATLHPLSDPESAARSHRQAVEGPDLARGIAARTRRRLDALPLSVDGDPE